MANSGERLDPVEARSGELYFGVDARHVRQLGRELVGDRVTALVELVKNAYDADATIVELRFATFLEGEFAFDDGSVDDNDASDLEGQLVVRDNGTGMSLADLSTGWMRIAGDNKERNPVSPRYARTRSGRKGIGRFAAESLGQHLTLWTTQEGDDTGVRIQFDWMADYSAGLDLQDVPNSYTIEPADPSAHGTELTIRGLHGIWTKTQRARVSRALLLLQPPFPVAEVAVGSSVITGPTPDPGFRVEYSVNGIEETSASIDGFLDGETAHISATLSDRGQLDLWVRSTRLGLDRRETLPGSFLIVGPFELSASYFVYLRDAIGVPVRSAQKLGAEYGGIRIFRDGMRLLPYGEPNIDWLGLDAKSRGRVYLNPIGNQNFFAQVLIGRDANPFLIDTSSREGLINNEAYDELLGALNLALLTASTWVAEHRQRRGKGSVGNPKPKVTRTQILNEAANAIRDALQEHLPTDVATRASRVVDGALDITSERAADSDRDDREELIRLQGEVELLRVLASLGTSISVFSHEVRSVLNSAASSLLPLYSADGLSANAKENVDKASKSVLNLRDIAKYIDAFTGGARDRQRIPQPLSQTLDNFVKTFASPLSKNSTIETFVDPVSLRTAPMGATALQAILINLFTNAVKAMDAENISVRRIRLSATVGDDKSKVLLRVSDSGVGVPEEIAERVFDAFVTTRRATDSDLGVGTGLGLKVVADLAEEYGGEAALIEPESGYSTTFQVTLPRWDKQK